MDSRNISVCIPSYNRPDMIMETIIPLINDNRIDEILLCDDCSNELDFKKLLQNVGNIKKVRVVKNVVNFHVQQNKRNAISFSKNEWCVVIDNDNVIDKNIIDKIYEQEWNSKTIYQFDFAVPYYNFGYYSGMTFTINNIQKYCEGGFVTLLNDNNFFVNRDEYLRVYQYNQNVRGADGIFFIYNWIKAGNSLYIIPNTKYFHRVHEGSEFGREPNNFNLVFDWMAKIRELK